MRAALPLCRVALAFLGSALRIGAVLAGDSAGAVTLRGQARPIGGLGLIVIALFDRAAGPA